MLEEPTLPLVLLGNVVVLSVVLVEDTLSPQQISNCASHDAVKGQRNPPGPQYTSSPFKRYGNPPPRQRFAPKVVTTASVVDEDVDEGGAVVVDVDVDVEEKEESVEW